MNKSKFKVGAIVDGKFAIYDVYSYDQESAENWLNAQLANSGAVYKIVR